MRVGVAVAAAACGLALGCASPIPAAPESATLRLGETGRIGGLRVRPLALVEDSRCPAEVRCIQAGTVRVSVAIGGDRETLALAEPWPVAGRFITLSAVEPEARADTPRAPADYRLRFTVEPAVRLAP